MKWLNDDSRDFLANGYLLPGVTPEARIREIADHAETLLGQEGFADKFYEYMSNGWYSLASPIWANFGLDRGLPISCFGSYVEDSMLGILDTAREVGMMSKYGGRHLGILRGRSWSRDAHHEQRHLGGFSYLHASVQHPD
jgi:ribonucleoside-diphosphate reductase alpha chain